MLARIHPLYSRIVAFILLFIVVSGIIGPWVIRSRLLYEFYFFIYGGLGKVLIFGAIAFGILARHKLQKVKADPYDKKDILFIVGGFVLIPLFFILGAKLLQEKTFLTNIPLFLITHIVVVVITLCITLGTFGRRFLVRFFSVMHKELLVACCLSLLFFFAFTGIFSLWYILSDIVLRCVKFLLDFGFQVSVYPPRTLVFKTFAVSIEQTCSGIESLFLFSGLYILIAIMDWKKFNHTKLILMFLPTLLGLFLVNILRVYLIILAGIFINPYVAVQLFHTYLGMVLFIVYFGLFWKISYKWMMK